MDNNYLKKQMETAIASSNTNISFTLNEWPAAAAITAIGLTVFGIYGLQVYRDIRLSERRPAYECCE